MWIRKEINVKDIEIGNTKLLYKLVGLQTSTYYDVRIVAENSFNKSLPSAIITAKTLSKGIKTLGFMRSNFFSACIYNDFHSNLMYYKRLLSLCSSLHIMTEHVQSQKTKRTVSKKNEKRQQLNITTWSFLT